MKDMGKLSSAETDDNLSSLLEFASNNDVESFKRSLELDLSAVDETGFWYVRMNGSKHISKEEMTPLMVAATYGSVDVLKLIVALLEVDLNRSCGRDKWTALHCAAFGGSVFAFDVVKLLLSAGADPNVENVNGQRPVDVIVLHPKLVGAKSTLEELLLNHISDGSPNECNLHVSLSSSNTSSPVLSSYDSVSPTALKISDSPAISASEKKQYPVDPSLPDIRNSVYSTDEFRMFSFKVRPCSRAYSHDWTECPFVHPGENARRRDPLKFHYTCVPCPEFRKGACRRADMCEYAHGVFECWLHPAQYRTRLCKDGTTCARQVCFFAHAQDELRPLYVSTGSGVPSPRSGGNAASFMDMAAALSVFPGSPPHSMISPTYDQIMSPTVNGTSHSSAAWPHPNVPALHLPGSNLQSSRLRSSISARDILPEEMNMLQDIDPQQLILNDLDCFPQPRPIPSMLSRSGQSNPSLAHNLDERFMAEIASSPRFSDQAAAASGVFSPTRKSAIRNQFQHQQTISSALNFNAFSPRSISSPRMSPRSVESLSPTSARLSSLAHQEKLQFHQQIRRDLGPNRASTVGSGTAAWPNWGPSNGKVDWSVKKSNSFELSSNGLEPDLPWVQSLVKESPPEMMDKLKCKAAVSTPPGAAAAATSGECLNAISQSESTDHSVLGAWLERMQLDQLVV